MAGNSDDPQTLAPEEAPAHPLKRKPDLNSVEESEADCKGKLPKLDSSPAAAPDANGVENSGSESDEVTAEAVDKKGKGKMVVEDEDDDDGGDSSSESSADGTMGDEDDDDDFVDDPLAEVDLDNILPSRTRRRLPPPPGAYLVTDQDGNDDDDDDDDDEDEDVEE